jgi:hypothetical protein
VPTIVFGTAAVYFTVIQRGVHKAYNSTTSSTSKSSTCKTGERIILAVSETDQVLVAGDVKICVMSDGLKKVRSAHEVTVRTSL